MMTVEKLTNLNKVSSHLKELKKEKQKIQGRWKEGINSYMSRY